MIAFALTPEGSTQTRATGLEENGGDEENGDDDLDEV